MIDYSAYHLFLHGLSLANSLFLFFSFFFFFTNNTQVLVIYNINTLIAEVVLSDTNENGALSFLYFFARLGVACIVGLLLALVLNYLIFWRPRIRRKSILYPLEQIFKHFIFLSAGFLIYFCSKLVHPWMVRVCVCVCVCVTTWVDPTPFKMFFSS